MARRLSRAAAAREFNFLGYWFGRMYSARTGKAYLGFRPVSRDHETIPWFTLFPSMERQTIAMPLTDDSGHGLKGASSIRSSGGRSRPPF
jgi:hypothetical protein